MSAPIAAQQAAAPLQSLPAARVITAWEVSSPFTLKPDAQPALPAPDVVGEFKRLETEPSGLLQFYRHLRVAATTRTAAAVARIRLRASAAGTCALDLGFSDIATVFVNRRPHAQLDASYSFDRPRREGLIGFDQARLFLSLQAGDNELAILLTDSFGGWGLMARAPSGATESSYRGSLLADCHAIEKGGNTLQHRRAGEEGGVVVIRAVDHQQRFRLRRRFVEPPALRERHDRVAAASDHE